MKRWTESIRKFLSDWAPKKSKPAAYRPKYLAELPNRPRAHELYVLQSNSQPWAVAMLCPCNCGALIQLSLLTNDSPRWRLSFDRKGRPTLSPSVWRTRGCKSHFFLRAGRIDWCKEPFSTGHIHLRDD